MRITSEADYAVRIVYCIASQKEKIGAKDISEQIGVSIRFCLKILRKLVMSGILRSYKGADGGYALAKPAKEITVLQVVSTIDGPILLNKCLESDADCSHDGLYGCKFKKIWFDLSKKVESSLNEVNFEDMIN